MYQLIYKNETTHVLDEKFYKIISLMKYFKNIRKTMTKKALILFLKFPNCLSSQLRDLVLYKCPKLQKHLKLVDFKLIV